MKVIITGGAGFVGSNAARHYVRRGDEVVLLDDLSRVGADQNLEWLKAQGQITFVRVDVRNAQLIEDVFRAHRDTGLILHLAGQVAVTTSVVNPRADFEGNALGTLNVLEGVRQAGIRAPLIYSSTNKVYGAMKEVKLMEEECRYAYSDLPCGISEEQSLDFHSPYGCSKGAADQYVRDYHRIYGLRTVVFRQSCIYGYRQFGVEDQGWVAWFTIAARLNRPITVYGDGKQVRDILFIDDLLDAFDAAYRSGSRAAGRVYNIGGGSENAVSVLDVLSYIEGQLGRPLRWEHREWRPGDQKVYVSDIRRAGEELGWTPRVPWRCGLDRLFDWVSSNAELFA